MENKHPSAWLVEVGLIEVSSEELDDMELCLNVGLVDDYEEMAKTDQSYEDKVVGMEYENVGIESFWDALTAVPTIEL